MSLKEQNKQLWDLLEEYDGLLGRIMGRYLPEHSPESVDIWQRIDMVRGMLKSLKLQHRKEVKE